MKLCQCRKCRKWWGISSFLTIPKQGYICPECAGDEQADYRNQDGWMIKKGA